jgi:hypothetical protein
VVRAVADALVQVWPDIERDTLLGQVLGANTDAVAEVGGRLCLAEAHQLIRASDPLLPHSAH